MGICMLWASFTLGAESSGTSESLCMLWEEDCRTAGLGKTERPVGWEGNGEPARRPLLRHCTRGNPQKQLGASTVTEPFLYPRQHRRIPVSNGRGSLSGKFTGATRKVWIGTSPG